MKEITKQRDESTQDQLTQKDDYDHRRVRAQFSETLESQRIEAEEVESLAPRVPFGRPETVYLAGALSPDFGLQAPNLFDPAKMAVNIERAMQQ
ncbi:MAG TPA: hypothetical protein ACFE0H_03145, partial [Elainellaceae cyanobacterium]